MTPGSFDVETCREMIGHEPSKVIEAKARADAEKMTYDPPKLRAGHTFWGQCQDNFAFSLYYDAYTRRLEKKARIDADGDNYDPPADGCGLLTYDLAYQLRVEENCENAVDSGPLDKIADEVLAANEKVVAQVKGGNDRAINALVGQVIGRCKKEGIQADAALINETLKRKISA